jgi:hypothetical protein
MFKPVYVVTVLLFSLLTTHIYANPVYIATDSRAYHYNRNCSDLNTTDLIEFASPQKADDAGAIPCKHCNSSGIIMADKDKQDKQSKEVSSNIQTEADSDEGVYVGDLKDGVKHGQGTITWPNGNKHVVEWKDDKLIGSKVENIISKPSNQSIQSFSIKGLKIGMSIQQARTLYPGKLERYQTTMMEDGSSLEVDFIEPGAYTKKEIIYQITWKSNFQYTKDTDDVLMKLQETYGKWSDIYCDRSNYYYVIWGAEFKNHTTRDGVGALPLFNLARIGHSRFRHDSLITDTAYFLAWIVPSDNSRSKAKLLKLRLYNYKIYDDAKAAEAARIKQREALNNLELR